MSKENPVITIIRTHARTSGASIEEAERFSDALWKECRGKVAEILNREDPEEKVLLEDHATGVEALRRKDLGWHLWRAGKRFGEEFYVAPRIGEIPVTMAHRLAMKAKELIFKAEEALGYPEDSNGDEIRRQLEDLRNNLNAFDREVRRVVEEV